MKKIVSYLLMGTLVSLLSGNVTAMDGFSKKASGEPQLVQKGEGKAWCPECGMSLKMFYKTSHTSQHKSSGLTRQYCSMRCLLVDMKNHETDINTVQVVDISSGKLIDAKTAFYVVGSTVPGTMAKVSKLAFSEKGEAEVFVKKMGGSVTDFNGALAAAKESLKSDIAMVNKKKQKKMYPMGKKVFEKLCDQGIDLNKYTQINELKAAIMDKNLCSDLKDPKKIQAVALYLWEVKRVSKQDENVAAIQVGKDEKCPVCGMFVYQYPKWVAQIHFEGGNHFSFDGVKDLMKFYFNPEKWGKYSGKINPETVVLVTDYYSQKSINGKHATYVIGSDILGPMGNELIPFSLESDAETFMKDHKGLKTVRFDELTVEDIYSLD